MLLKRLLGVADRLAPDLRDPVVLIYHQVGADLGREMEVPLGTFVRQMRRLAEHEAVIPLERALAERSAGSVVISFDDGFRDLYEHAFPVLRELRLPFTLFLTTGPLETGAPLDPRYPEAEPLSWAMVEDMLGSGLMTVGAHTHTHRSLPSMTAAELEEDLGVCDELIEKRLGVTPTHFAYPWGAWFADVEPIVARRYATAWTGGGWSLSWDDPGRLPRVPVQRSDDDRLFERKLLGGQRLEYLVRDKRVRRRQRSQAVGPDSVSS